MLRSIVLLLLAVPALATTPPKHHKPPPAPVAVAVADADASAKANANAAAVSGSKSNANATGGNATATGGNSDASSNSGGNELTVNDVQVRQAPGFAQGSFAIVGCGVAANAGGSAPGGGGFLGFGYTPSQCYDFMLANAYCQAGATQACCEVLNNSKAGQRAKARGVRLPDCTPVVHEPPPAPTPQPPVIVQLPCCDKPPPECPPDNHCYDKCDKLCKQQCDGNAACEKRCETLCKRRCDGEPPGPPGTTGSGSCAVPEQSKPN